MIDFCYYDVICIFVIMEKLMLVFEQNQVVFNVVKDVFKFEIKVVVEVFFGVKVKVVNMLVCKGKMKCFCGFVGKQLDVKKVVVIFVDGQFIDVFIGL